MAVLAVLQHAWNKGAQGMADAIKIDAHDPVPILLGGFPGRLGYRDAGVIHQQMYVAEPGECLVRQGIYLFFPGDVGRHAYHFDTHGFEAGHRCFQLGGVDIGQHQFHSLGRDPRRDPFAYAFRSAGNDGDLALQILHMVSCRFRIS
jgi:hypothetical protein